MDDSSSDGARSTISLPAGAVSMGMREGSLARKERGESWGKRRTTIEKKGPELDLLTGSSTTAVPSGVPLLCPDAGWYGPTARPDGEGGNCCQIGRGMVQTVRFQIRSRVSERAHGGITSPCGIYSAAIAEYLLLRVVVRAYPAQHHPEVAASETI